jgi:serine/threonine protein kinase
MIRQLTENLEGLHEKIVVHRDISPHNVFLTDRAKEIHYVLGDFGSSKPANVYDIDNSTTRMAFHDRYLDPALFMNDRFRYDSRIDIYQLGVIITEILMGEYWQTDDEESVVSGIQGVDFEKEFLMTFALNDIHPYIVEKIRKATTRKINRRYRTASEFRKEIHEALQRVEEKGKKIKPKEGIKKNISISYKRVLQSPPEQEGTGKGNGHINMETIDYKGEKRIDMGTADQIRLRFTGLQLINTKMIGSSFLKCQQANNSILLQVDTEDIKKRVQPIMKPGIITTLSHALGSRIPGFRGSRGQRPDKPGKKPQNQFQPHLRIEFDCQAILYIEAKALSDHKKV